MTPRRKTFLFNTDWANIARQFAREVQLDIYNGLIDFVATGEEPKLSETARMGYMFIRRELDEINEKYEARLEQCRENGKKGGAPKGTRNNPNGRRGKKADQEPTGIIE